MRPKKEKKRDEPQRPKESVGKTKEQKIYGVMAVEALWRKRPNDIIRAYLTPEVAPLFGPLMKHCAATRRAYHIVSGEDLSKVTSSVHHEGVCVLAKARKVLSEQELCDVLGKGSEAKMGVFLDGVGNPHNIGAIARTAAHFGADCLMTLETATSQITPSGARIAEGGFESVELAEIASLERVARKLSAQGFAWVAASQEAKQNLFEAKLPAKVIFMLGSEVHGLSKDARRVADFHFAIPGVGAIESLNVSNAAAIMMAEFFRRHRK